MKLTKKEQKEYEYKKRVFELASKRIKEIDNIVEYRYVFVFHFLILQQ